MTTFEKDLIEIAESLRRQREDLSSHIADRTNTQGETADILRKIESLRERLKRTSQEVPPPPPRPK